MIEIYIGTEKKLNEKKEKLSSKAKELIENYSHRAISAYRKKYIDNSNVRYGVSPFACLTVLRTLYDNNPEAIFDKINGQYTWEAEKSLDEIRVAAERLFKNVENEMSQIAQKTNGRGASDQGEYNNANQEVDI